MHTEEWYKNWKKPEVVHGVPTEYGWVAFYPEKLRMGRWVDVGYGTILQAQAGIYLGDEVQIGGLCGLYSMSTIGSKSGPITLGNRVEIGVGVVIMPNVTIGHDSVVGAGCFVNHDIPTDMAVYPEQKLIYKRRPQRI